MVKEWSKLRTVRASALDEIVVTSSITIDEDGKLKNVLSWKAIIRYDDGHVVFVNGPIGDMVTSATRENLADITLQVYRVISKELLE